MANTPAPVAVVFDLTFAVRADPDPETKLYEAVCVELQTASVGLSIDEAIRNIRDAVDLELDTFETSTELVRYLREYGANVWTDGDAFREFERLKTSPRELEYGTLSMPERFKRELSAV